MFKTESYVGTWTDVVAETSVSVPEGGGIIAMVVVGALLLIISAIVKGKMR